MIPINVDAGLLSYPAAMSDSARGGGHAAMAVTTRGASQLGSEPCGCLCEPEHKSGLAEANKLSVGFGFLQGHMCREFADSYELTLPPS